MSSYFSDSLVTLKLGDCVEVMATFDSESVDAVVTDPPYGIRFMGKAWDERHQHEPWSREAYRLLKPGGYLLAFGGTRTVHRLASAIEDAGFEIRDCLVWAYASGFPKSLDVSKAIDKAAGAEREVVGVRDRFPDGGRGARRGVKAAFGGGSVEEFGAEVPVYAPATDAAKRWQGWGTALKPAWEPIVMARKPLRGTVAANVTAYGTGALNIDGTRIGFASEADKQANNVAEPGMRESRSGFGGGMRMAMQDAGRWPANVILTDPLFDGGVPGVVGGGVTNNQSGGPFTPSGMKTRDYQAAQGYRPAGPPYPNEGQATSVTGYGDTGTYSRFFLIPKAARSDREPLVRGLPEGLGPVIGQARRGRCVGCGRWKDRAAQNICPCGGAYEYESNAPKARENLHPTVKPLELMRHLVRLVTPPGGTVLDCFLGSGSTAIAANMEGFRCIGIERELEYLEIAVARLQHQKVGMGL